MLNIILFLIAAILAAIGEVKHFIRNILTALKNIRKKKYPYNYEERLKACQNCKIYFKPLKTCGTPFRFTKTTSTSGCWCFMPYKAAIPESTCWLDENYIKGGWGELW